ncbi:ribonuclease PH [Nannocystis radixulma]|uniref:Ribonuclease PH n=1 Tax=Nannocystis radixulma TaxID=2995305 RepID=A0ABT5BG39_9BACT|nr:ribonuclease PH [Nannocystis radixulma]MDC0673099.1 ribonuclease PH [Nannocystis radixulma]
MRHDGRDLDQLRPFSLEPGFIGSALGSVLVATGRTRVICTASREAKPPGWLTQGGWVTAEYAMLPGAVRPRGRREPDGRAKEIQRLIGRSLRAAIDLEKLVGPQGPVALTVDCDVIEADGGTRTAAITGGMVALALAIRSLQREGVLTSDPVRALVAAVSVGVCPLPAAGAEVPMLDLAYTEDSQAIVDCNVVMLERGGLVEIQGTGERGGFDRAALSRMLDLAESGIASLWAAQRAALAKASEQAGS